MERSEHTQANRLAWNEAAPIHRKQKFDQNLGAHFAHFRIKPPLCYTLVAQAVCLLRPHTLYLLAMGETMAAREGSLLVVLRSKENLSGEVTYSCPFLSWN